MGRCADEEVARRIREGSLQLPRPEVCTDSAWDLMTRCWASARTARPSFLELKLHLQRLRAALAHTPSVQPPLPPPATEIERSSGTEIAAARAAPAGASQQEQTLVHLPPSSSFKIYVQTLSGQVITVDCHHQDMTVLQVKLQIDIKEGIPPYQQQLLYDGRQLHSQRTLGYYKIEKGATLFLVLELRGGCIAAPIPAVFGHHELLAFGSEYLVSDIKLKSATLGEVKKLCAQLGASSSPPWKPMQDPVVVLDSKACQVLRNFLDWKHSNHTIGNPEGSLGGAAEDFRITVTAEEVVDLIGFSAFRRVAEAFGGPFNTIRMRRVVGKGQVGLLIK